jgi:hypothetical protein
MLAAQAGKSTSDSLGDRLFATTAATYHDKCYVVRRTSSMGEAFQFFVDGLNHTCSRFTLLPFDKR